MSLPAAPVSVALSRAPLGTLVATRLRAALAAPVGDAPPARAPRRLGTPGLDARHPSLPVPEALRGRPLVAQGDLVAARLVAPPPSAVGDAAHGGPNTGLGAVRVLARRRWPAPPRRVGSPLELFLKFEDLFQKHSTRGIRLMNEAVAPFANATHGELAVRSPLRVEHRGVSWSRSAAELFPR